MAAPQPKPKRSLFEMEWEANDEDVATAQDEEDNPDVGPKELEDGWRKVVYPSGNIYEGDILNTEMHGNGTLTFADGFRVYTGEFRNHQQHGVGKLSNSQDGSMYDGEWVAGRKCGNATTILSNGDKFVGLYANGKMVSGTYHHADGRVYTGPFLDGALKHGVGKLVQTNGDSYEGEFSEGKMTGMCTMHYAATGKVFTGHVINSKKIRGKMAFKDGSYYDGEFVSEKPDGRGERRSKDGDVYVGDWRNGAMCGVGTMTLAPGKKFTKYVGEWKADKYHGRGTITLEGGKEIEADWIEGKTVTNTSASAPAAASPSTTTAAPAAAKAVPTPTPTAAVASAPKPKPSAPPAASTKSSNEQPPASDSTTPTAVVAPTPSVQPPPQSTASQPATTANKPAAAPEPTPKQVVPAAATTTAAVVATPEVLAEAARAAKMEEYRLRAERAEKLLEYRQRVERLYAAYAPDKLAGVDIALARYENREEELMQTLITKYGPEPTTVPQKGSAPPAKPTAPVATKVTQQGPAASSNGTPQTLAPKPAVETMDYRKRVERVYAKYAPDRLPDVDRAMGKYVGREAELIRLLVEKYGPEPTATEPLPPPKPQFDLDMLGGGDDSGDDSDDGGGKKKKPAAAADQRNPSGASPSPSSQARSGPPLPPCAADAVCSGYLDKYSVGKSFFSFGNWQKRFFVLDDRGLCYFKAEEPLYPAGIAPLNCEICRLVSKPTPKTHKEVNVKLKHLEFVLVYYSTESGKSKEYKLLMKAPTEEDKAMWVEELTKCVKCVDDPQDFPEL